MKINKNISRGRGRMAVSGRTLVALKKKNSCVYPAVFVEILVITSFFKSKKA